MIYFMRLILLFLFLSSFSLLQAQIQTFPYVDNFETGNPNTIEWIPDGSNNVWVKGNPSKSQISGAYSGTNAWCTGLVGNYPQNRLQFVKSPKFNFSQLSDLPYLRFKYNMKTEACCDYVKFEYSLDDGTNWVTVGDHNSGQNWYNDSTVSYWSGNSNGWKVASIKLDDLPQSLDLEFRFLFFSDYSQNDEGFAFDDFEIRQNFTDVGLIDVAAPKMNSCSYSNSENVSVFIKNLGQATVSNTTISYQLDSGNVISQTISSLITDTLLNFTFPQTIDLSQNGSYVLKIWINANGDTYSLNDTLIYQITNLTEITTFPFLENFENGQGDWNSDGKNNTWQFGKPAKMTIRNAKSGQNAWVTGNTGFGLYNNNENSYVESPCFNTTGLSTAQLRLAIWWESESAYDGANIEYTLNDGITWNLLDNNSGINWYNQTNVDGMVFTSGQKAWSGNKLFDDGSSTYVNALISENQLAGKNSLRFRINFGSDVNTRDEGIAFDDFSLGSAVAEDLSLNNLNKSIFEICEGESDSLFVFFQNFGSQILGNFNIHYQIGAQNDSVLYAASLAIQATDSLYLSDFSTLDSGSYEIVVFHSINTDGYSFNDTLKARVNIYKEKNPAFANSVQICDSSRALLGASGDGLVKWYSDSLRENLIFVGDTFLTSILSSDTNFYLSNSRGKFDTILPVNQSIGSGSYTNVTSRTRIEVLEHMTLASANVYVTGNGSFDVTVENEDGSIVTSRKITTSTGRKRVYLGFDLFEGNYILKVHNFTGITLYRNTSGADYANYGNSYFAMLGNGVDPEYYYYLYDIVTSKSEPCYGESMIQVTRASVIPEADFAFDQNKNRFFFYNRSQSGLDFTWIFENISNSTMDSSKSVNPEIFLDSGEYLISLIAKNNCGTDTIIRSFNITEISAIENQIAKKEIGITVFPNPARGFFNWSISGKGKANELIVYDLMGNVIHKENPYTNSGRIQIRDWKSGYYIVLARGDLINTRSRVLVQN